MQGQGSRNKRASDKANIQYTVCRTVGTMSQFRSEEMNLVQLFVQSDAAHETLHELGQIGALQFKDVRPCTAAPPCLCSISVVARNEHAAVL